MIFDFFSSSLENLKNFIIDIVVRMLEVLPASEGIPTHVGEGLLSAWQFTLSLDFLIPFSHIPYVLAVLISFEIAVLIFLVVRWLLGLIAPGGS